MFEKLTISNSFDQVFDISHETQLKQPTNIDIHVKSSSLTRLINENYRWVTIKNETSHLLPYKLNLTKKPKLIQFKDLNN